MAKKPIKTTRRKRDEKRENVKWSRNPAVSKLTRPRSSKALRDYFQGRQKKLEVAATTTTPSGQIIDWVPIQSQLRGAEKIADPPPPPEYAARSRGRAGKPVRFELEYPDVRRGPKGTVPILRKRLDRLPAESLQNYLSKHRHQVRDWVRTRNGMDLPMPEPGAHWYASAVQSAVAFGAEGFLSAFDPFTETSGDFSLIQVALINRDLPQRQTIEAGWQECYQIYGDWVPHLFLFYTTNGHTENGDDIGGYNQDVDGWVQHDGSIYPGAVYSPTSVIGGQQYEMWIKFQLFQDNWWFWCNDRWLGYYPARLFMGNQTVFSTLGDHADQIHFFGEIYDSDELAGNTTTDMCSGQWPSARWQRSGYMRNLRIQNRASKMNDFDGGTSVSDPNRYDLESHMKSGSNWGSYMWIGGPGAG
jgi:Neprosin